MPAYVSIYLNISLDEQDGRDVPAPCGAGDGGQHDRLQSFRHTQRVRHLARRVRGACTDPFSYTPDELTADRICAVVCSSERPLLRD